MGQALPREEVLRREEWLDDTDVDVAGMLSKTLSSFGSLMRGKGWSDACQSGSEQLEEAWADQNKASELEARRSETIESNEASWLVERIGRDGVIHENERALVTYLKQESPYIDPALESLIEKIA